MSGASTSPTAPGASNASAPQKAHNKRESTGHVCTACDQCYRCKVRCSGERPICERCRANNSACTYSTGKPLGKPKGSKNKVQRSKSTNDINKPTIAPAKATSSNWTSSAATKRPNDGVLPPSKRSYFDSRGSESHSQLEVQPLPSPTTISSALPNLTPAILRPEEGGPVPEPLPYYSEPLTHHDASAGLLDHAEVSEIDDVFPSAGLNLEIDDFHWFTQVGSTPTAAQGELANQDASPDAPAPYALLPPASATATHQGIVPKTSPEEHLALVYRPLPPPQQPLPCLCDPLSLGIISELHNLQLSLSPLDTALILARRGLMTVSSYLSCPSCLSHLSSTPSLFLACILILQQVFTCYLTVRVQGVKMLQASSHEEDSLEQVSRSNVSIGDFEVEGEESCSGVLDAIVKAEMEKGHGIIGGLERWVEKAESGCERVAGMLLRALREEIGFAAAC